ncbi:class A beta-lactamase [Streptomonospora sediminis]
MFTRPGRATRFAAAAALALVPLAGCATAETATPTAGSQSGSGPAVTPGEFKPQFKKLEKEFDATLGVYALDTGSNEAVAYNAGDRFGYASTHKAFSAGAVLDQTPVEDLDKHITYTEDDLLEYAPITEKHVDEGMELQEVMDAAVRYSDNTAANLLFRELGGPSGLQDALTELGDDTTHVDRIEPELNEWQPGDIEDSSTPKAMAETLRAYTLGDALPAEKREILVDMLHRNTTGDGLVRAGVPEDWKVGDKSGGGDYTRNDIAVIWPPEDDPIVIAVMSYRDVKDYDDALIAGAAEVAVDALD